MPRKSSQRPASRTTPDAYVKAILKANPNMLVPHYLMACYRYYELDAPFITDKLFDDMSKELLAKWDSIEHRHKDLISLDDLRAGTGYAIKYPTIVKHAANHMVWSHEQGALSPS